MMVRTFVAIAVLAAGAAAPLQEGRRAPFEVRYIVAHGNRIDTQLYDFTGDGLRDALMVSIDYDVDPPARWLALHVGTKAGGIPEKPDQIWSAAPTTCAIALGNVVPEGGVDVLEVAPDGVSYHAFEKGSMTEEPRKLIHTRTFFTAASSRSLPLWAAPVDLSNDGLDDLILPIPDGYKVYFQTEPGKFGVVTRLESDLAPNQRPSVVPVRFAADWDRLMARGLPSTSAYFNLRDELPRITPVDLDGDGLKDLVAINGSKMTVFFQQPAKRFPAKLRKLSTLSTLSEEQKKDAVSVADIQFCNIDGDEAMDLVVTKIEGELGLMESIKTRIYVHMGSGRGTFSPDAVIFVDGISLNPTFIDMDGDKGLDVLTSRLRTDIISKGLEKVLMGDITVTYEVFQFDKKPRTYSAAPVYSRDIFIRTEDITNSRRRAASRPLFQVGGDLSGDGRPDAVLYDLKTSTLEVRRGRPVWQLGGSRQIIDFELDTAATFDISKITSHDPKWVSYMDIDGDGRQDIVLNYGGQLITLLSRF